jgi:hypothetical protein
MSTPPWPSPNASHNMQKFWSQLYNTFMQDMILIQLGLKTYAHNLHSHAKSANR